MADITESAVTAGVPVGLSSLASFRALSMQDASSAKADTGDIARVAAELLTDARQVRGVHGDAIVVAPTGSAEHELHVNLHACERAALAAQRRGVEALTAKLRNDDELLATIRASAFGDLESAAQSLLSAASLSDQLLSSEAVDGPPPPPVPEAADLSDGEVVVDLTGETADLAYRPTDMATLADLAFGDSATESWEDRRAAILERVDQVRRPRSEAEETVPAPPLVAPDEEPLPAPPTVTAKADSSPVPIDSDDPVSPIVAAARSQVPLHSEAPPAGSDLVDLPVDVSAPLEEAPPASPEVEDVADTVVTHPVDAVDAVDVVDVAETEDAVIIDIGQAPSTAPVEDEDPDLAEVIELQTEATVHEWPVWQGPARERGEAHLDEVIVPAGEREPVADTVAPAPSSEETVTVDEAGYPRLVSVAPDPAVPPPVEPPPVAPTEPARRTFSFAPEPPSESMLPVPFGELSDRKSPEEIAAEARQLIAVQQKTEAASTFSPKEVRRRQRRLRGHQRAVEKAESRVQRDRRRAELEHERSLAANEVTPAIYSPSWFSQLAFAIAICVLVIMVAVGLWFLLADDPGLF